MIRNIVFLEFFQSQPCHWRNTKSLKKRDTGIEDGNNNETNFGLSNNINLFQSLRVLQEGESPSDNNLQQNSTLGNLICLKHGAFSTIIGKLKKFSPTITIPAILTKKKSKRKLVEPQNQIFCY